MTQVLNLVQAHLTESKSYSNYRTAIRGAIRALYNKEYGLFAFVDSMRAAIEFHYKKAWAEGAGECGIKEDEFTEDELAKRELMINEQIGYVPDFGKYIIEGRDDKPIGVFFDRGDGWANRWFEVKATGNQMACENQKKKWVWEPSKEHCCDCRNMNGRVYRNKTWERYGIRPASSSLACFGTKCGCRFEDTDAKITPGKPPVLKGPGGCK